MRYLLDSNAVIALLRGNLSVLHRLTQHRPADFGIPAIVAHELFYGAYRGLRLEENLARVDALQFQIVDFDNEDARQSGEVRAQLVRNGEPIGPYDVLIAGQALARHLILITHNTQEFRRVPGLAIEDWE